LEDSLVSTLGTITGIAIATQSTYFVILSGLVLIASESTSMAAGSYLSSRSAEDAEQEEEKEEGKKFQREPTHPVSGAFVMFFSYLLGGLIPLGPYFLVSTRNAILPSVILTVVTLFLIGVWSSSYTKRSRTKSGLEMVVVSLSAAVFGYLISQLVNHYFGVSFKG
ncbi:MAG: VIT1/CCC1 transporter family protein, partial [Patescibacteria group bacterium]